MDISEAELKNIIKNAMEKLISNEGIIIKNRINERTLTAHLANYLEPFFPYFNIDCEYNRNYELGRYRPKYISGHTSYPDIIIHKRLENKHNLVCIEVKTSYFNNGKNLKDEIKKDKKKLIDFVTPDDGYNFKYGIFIFIDADSLKYTNEYFNDVKKI